MKNLLKNVLKKLRELFFVYKNYLFLIAPVSIFIDQVSKYCVVTYKIFPYYFNSAVAFSLPIPWYLPWIVFIIVGFLVFFVTPAMRPLRSFFESLHFDDPLFFAAYMFIIGGGISNLIDRFIYQGSVVDFIDLRYWPVFNFADVFIVCGLLLFLCGSYIKSSIGSIKEE